MSFAAIVLAAMLQSASLTAPPFAAEGAPERLTVRFPQAVQEPVALEVYEFHYFQHPELAPGMDTWKHDAQMRYMREVRRGERAAYSPSMDDPKVRRILELAQPSRLELRRVDERSYAADWTPGHGRFYFRVLKGGRPLEVLASTRVHCGHADLRSVERLKAALRALGVPLDHGNVEMASEALRRIRQIYEQGHGLRFMLDHHEFEGAFVEAALDRLALSLDQGNLGRARSDLKNLSAAVDEAEDQFRQAEISRENGLLKVRLSDLPSHDYAGSPQTRVFLRPTPAPGRFGHEPRNASAHRSGPQGHGAPIDLESLLKDALPLRLSGDSFVAKTPPKAEGIELVVLYGANQEYFWTEPVRW